MKLNRILNLIIVTTIALVPCITPEKPSPEVIDQIGKLILERIGLTEPPPKATAKKNGPIQTAKEDSIRAYRRNTEVADEKLVDNVTLSAQVSSGGTFLVFSFKKDLMSEQGYYLKSAKLTLTPSKELLTLTGKKALIEIHRKKRKHNLVDVTKSKLVNSKYVNVLEIRDDVEKWKQKRGSKAEYRLRLRCSKPACIEAGSVPTLDLEYHKHRPKQPERSKSECKDGQCCRKSIRVTVEDLGWDDWFFTPEAFDYHYCQGSCTKAKRSPYTSLLRSLNSQPCCAPTELSSIRVLYKQDQLIYDKVIYNFMTESCACGGIAGL